MTIHKEYGPAKLKINTSGYEDMYCSAQGIATAHRLKRVWDSSRVALWNHFHRSSALDQCRTGGHHFLPLIQRNLSFCILQRGIR
jgi:hypothetical protein